MNLLKALSYKRVNTTVDLLLKYLTKFDKNTRIDNTFMKDWLEDLAYSLPIKRKK